MLAFDILSGKIQLDDPEAANFLRESIQLQPDQVDWRKAEDWCNWWARSKVVKMFTKAFTEMTDAEWELCPRTTNAVEAQNKLSHASNSTSAIVQLDDWYREDKKHAFQYLAPQHGIQIGQSKLKRKESNKKRRKKRLQPKVVKIVEEAVSSAAEISIKRKRGRPAASAARTPAKRGRPSASASVARTPAKPVAK